MIRFSHEANSWQEYYRDPNFPWISGWKSISADIARNRFDDGYKLEPSFSIHF